MTSQIVSSPINSRFEQKEVQKQNLSSSIKEVTTKVLEYISKGFTNVFDLKIDTSKQIKSFTTSPQLEKQNEIKDEKEVNLLKKEELLPYLMVFLYAQNYPISILTGCSTFIFSKILSYLFLDRMLKGIDEEEIKKSNFVKSMNESSTMNKIIIIPIFEEILCRGFIQNTLSSVFGKNIGLLSSAFFFGGAHLLGAEDKVSYRLQSFQAMCATIGGLVLGVINNNYGLSSSIATHMVHNALCVFL